MEESVTRIHDERIVALIRFPYMKYTVLRVDLEEQDTSPFHVLY